jgi:SOS-response transcriptional repressor LexA
MEPILSQNDIVCVNLSRRDPTELHNGIIAAMIDGGVTVKYFRMVENTALLIPENMKEYNPTSHSIDELDLLIVGMVEWWLKKA